MVGKDLLIGNARHRLAHKLFRVFDGQKILRQRLSVPPRAAARFLDHIGNKRLTQRWLLFKDLGHEAIQIRNLRAVFAQKLREPVVLSLRAVEIRNVVKQKLLHRLRAQVLKLPARALEKHPFQLPDLAGHMNRHSAPSHILFSSVSDFPALCNHRKS